MSRCMYGYFLECVIYFAYEGDCRAVLPCSTHRLEGTLALQKTLPFPLATVPQLRGLCFRRCSAASPDIA